MEKPGLDPRAPENCSLGVSLRRTEKLGPHPRAPENCPIGIILRETEKPGPDSRALEFCLILPGPDSKLRRIVQYWYNLNKNGEAGDRFKRSGELSNIGIILIRTEKPGPDSRAPENCPILVQS
jgi:hypothetical protein